MREAQSRLRIPIDAHSRGSVAINYQLDIDMNMASYHFQARDLDRVALLISLRISS